MSLRLILLAGVAMTALSGAARAEDTYRCGDAICHDDQADETRRLNELQLENPGAGVRAVPGTDDSYDSADSADDDGAYAPDDTPDTYQSDDDAYPDEDAPSGDGYGDDDDMPCPDEDDD